MSSIETLEEILEDIETLLNKNSIPEDEVNAKLEEVEKVLTDCFESFEGLVDYYEVRDTQEKELQIEISKIV